MDPRLLSALVALAVWGSVETQACTEGLIVWLVSWICVKYPCHCVVNISQWRNRSFLVIRAVLGRVNSGLNVCTVAVSCSGTGTISVWEWVVH